MSDELNKVEETTKTVKLDGQDVTVEQLEEAKKKPSVRIVENNGEYKTLQKLEG